MLLRIARRMLLATLLVSCAAAADAGEGGIHLRFGGARLKARIAAGDGVHADDVLWRSPESDKVKSPFDKVFFQGVLQNGDMRFQAGVLTDQNWGPWVDAELDAAPNGRFWAQVAVSGAAGARVRLRALSKTGARDNAELFDFFAAEAEDEAGAHGGLAGGMTGGASLRADGAEVPTPPAPIPPPAPTVMPAVLPRSAWGAKKATRPYEPMLPDRISVHHTEAFQAFSQNDAAQEMRVIQSFHQKGRGWIDIGYHFLIDGSGRVWEGRPVGVVGAHVKNKNDGNIGISMMGDFHPPKNNQPGMAQTQSLVALLRYLTVRYKIPVARIKGHRDQDETSCPGDILYARLGDIRDQVSAGAPTVAVPDAGAIRLAFGSLEP